MNIYICATPVSLAAFVVANVCDNVRLQHLQDCLYYRIKEKGNRSRDGFIFEGGIGKKLVHRLLVYLAGGIRSDAHF